MAYWRVFEYLYTGGYSDGLSSKALEGKLNTIFCPAYHLTDTDDPKLLRDARVYALADMFFLEELKNLSVAKLKQELDNASIQWKRKIALCDDAWSDAFLECIREIYATTLDYNCALRKVVVEFTAD
jgi:hypothetical protein